MATTVTLATLFVFLAGFNVWTMLSNRGGTPRSAGRWRQAHRIAGYAFIALYLILCYFMVQRLRGLSDELPARLVMHAGLALLLAPLLATKLIVARYQKAARGLLTALGVGIFAVAFTLVGINLLTAYERTASPHGPPAWASLTFVLVVLAAAAVLLLAGRIFGTRRPVARSGDGVASLSNAGSVTANQSTAREAGPGASMTLTLGALEAQTHDAKTLRFLLPRGQTLSARPGQFMTFEWVVEGKTTPRSYSICSSPLQSGYFEITVKRVEHGLVSHCLNDRAAVGMSVQARGPYGKFCFDEREHRRIVLIAGGSGITPMMSMLRYIADLCLPVEVTLIYSVRAQRDVFFSDELARLQERLPAFRYVPVLTQESGSWEGWRGRLRREILEREVRQPLESTFFLCGPPALMELGRRLLKELGVEDGKILQESFGGGVGVARAAAAAASELQVMLSRSRASFNCSPRETILEAADRAGVLIPSGCRQGVCGTCITKLVTGEVQMEGGEALGEEQRAQGYILPCVSKVRDSVTLER